MSNVRRIRAGSGRRGGGVGKSGVGAAGIWGLGGWDTSTALATASPGGIAGSAVTGVSVVVFWTLTAVPSGVEILSHRFVGLSGWWYICNGSALQARCGNGVAQAVAPQRTMVAGDLTKLHVSCLSCDITAAYHYFDRAQVGTSTALAGYAVAANRTTLGSDNVGASPGTNLVIFGVAGRDSHLTLADYQTICDATKSSGTLDLGGVSMDHQWRSPQNSTVQATVSDEIGADGLSFVAGSAANLTSTKYPFNWGF